MFSLLSDVYLKPGAEAGEELSESIDEVSLVVFVGVEYLLAKELSVFAKVCDIADQVVADQVLAGPEGVVPQDVPDREVFSLLSDFYLTPGAEADEKLSESIDEVSFV